MPCCVGESENRRRRNGLETPFHPLQVATWLLFAGLAALFFAFLRPMLWTANHAQTVLTAAYCLLCALTAGAAYVTCSIDPMDAALCGETLARDEPHLYCYVCETDVHESSKHCRYCDKCVTRFDHHCKW